MNIQHQGIAIGKPGTVQVTINTKEGYGALAELIEAGDMIETKIRRKEASDRRNNKKVFFTDATVVVDGATTDSESVHVTGGIVSSDKRVKGTNTKQSIWLIDGCDFLLTKKNWSKRHMELIENLENPEAWKAHEPKSLERDQVRAIETYRELLNTDSESIVFGEAACIYAADSGAVKTLIVTTEFLTRQTDERQKLFGDESGKYRGCSIVVFGRDSPNYRELDGLGGVVALLKFHFDTSGCF